MYKRLSLYLAPTARSCTEVDNLVDALQDVELVVDLHQLESAPIFITNKLMTLVQV